MSDPAVPAVPAPPALPASPASPASPAPPTNLQSAGRRKKQNPWLAHVKDTMRKNRGVSFKKVLKLAKKTFKKSKSRRGRQSQSQSQSAGRKNKRGGFKLDQLLQQQDQEQKGGSGVGGGKEGAATLAGSAAPVA
jgi:hypothetical protein